MLILILSKFDLCSQSAILKIDHDKFTETKTFVFPYFQYNSEKIKISFKLYKMTLAFINSFTNMS